MTRLYNCIFTPHCTNTICDKSCPAYVESSYLLERNGIHMNSQVFKTPDNVVKFMQKVLTKFNGTTGGLVVKAPNDTIPIAEALVYCAICQNWLGSNLHCTVYNLKFSKYLDELKKGWSNKGDAEALDYMRIWSETAKILIVSHFDYVTFNDYECQTLLNLIQTRTTDGLTTILVSPEPKNLMSSKGTFLNTIKSRWLGGSSQSNVLYYDIGGGTNWK